MSGGAPGRRTGWADGVPAAIKAAGFLSFGLCVTLVLLVHHYLTTWKCPIPR